MEVGVGEEHGVAVVEEHGGVAVVVSVVGVELNDWAVLLEEAVTW